MKRKKREERLEMIRNNVQLKYVVKRKVSHHAHEHLMELYLDIKIIPSHLIQVNEMVSSVHRAMKRMRHSSCFSSVRRSRSRQQEIKKTRS